MQGKYYKLAIIVLCLFLSSCSLQKTDIPHDFNDMNNFEISVTEYGGMGGSARRDFILKKEYFGGGACCNWLLIESEGTLRQTYTVISESKQKILFEFIKRAFDSHSDTRRCFGDCTSASSNSYKLKFGTRESYLKPDYECDSVFYLLNK
jgi:hypothetical protein